MSRQQLDIAPYYYHPESCFFRKIFKKQMGKGNRLHAGEPPALHIASD